MSRSAERPRTAQARKPGPAKKPRPKGPPKASPKAPRRQLRFEATSQYDHVHMQANIPTQWLRLLFKVLIIIVIAVLILKAPEVLQAIQAAINLVPK